MLHFSLWLAVFCMQCVDVWFAFHFITLFTFFFYFIWRDTTFMCLHSSVVHYNAMLSSFLRFKMIPICILRLPHCISHLTFSVKTRTIVFCVPLVVTCANPLQKNTGHQELQHLQVLSFPQPVTGLWKEKQQNGEIITLLPAPIGTTDWLSVLLLHVSVICCTWTAKGWYQVHSNLSANMVYSSKRTKNKIKKTF